eukprot:4976061-Amphidinium_carterae.1
MNLICDHPLTCVCMTGGGSANLGPSSLLGRDPWPGDILCFGVHVSEERKWVCVCVCPVISCDWVSLEVHGALMMCSCDCYGRQRPCNSCVLGACPGSIGVSLRNFTKCMRVLVLCDGCSMRQWGASNQIRQQAGNRLRRLRMKFWLCDSFGMREGYLSQIVHVEQGVAATHSLYACRRYQPLKKKSLDLVYAFARQVRSWTQMEGATEQELDSVANINSPEHDLPDFDEDVEECSHKLGGLLMPSKAEAISGKSEPAHVEEIFSDDNIWIDGPGKVESVKQPQSPCAKSELATEAKDVQPSSVG